LREVRAWRLPAPGFFVPRLRRNTGRSLDEYLFSLMNVRFI
jgi:hypothetical protein